MRSCYNVPFRELVKSSLVGFEMFCYLKNILRCLPHRLRRLPYCMIWLFGLCVSGVIIFSYYLSDPNILNLKETECDLTHERGFSEMPLLLTGSNCRIPDIGLNESCVTPLMKHVNFLEDCFNNYYHWTYVNEKSIVINTTAVVESGYKVDAIEFCYEIVRRKIQDENNYDTEADNVVSYSSKCFPMQEITQPATGEFFMVIGREKSWKGWFRNLYRNYHWILSIENSSEVQSKLEYWNNKDTNSGSGSGAPPNVLLVGLDSTSRLNFLRQMPKTKTVLENLGAVQMLGYTKVGDNTFPNFGPMLSGYSTDDLAKICQVTPWNSKQDDCPYIWKRFSQANYFTALLEDGPFYTGFNYKKTGFVNQPMDFYLRPLMLAANEYDARATVFNKFRIIKNDHIDCVGHRTNDETIVDSIKQLIDLSTMTKVPLYLHTWSTVLAHDDFNFIRLLDGLYSDLLEHLYSNHQLNNTILFFLGDHGYRFGKIRDTFSGWYEEKLPLLWIYVSPDLRAKFPEWQKNLQTNSKRLISTYHLYWTMNEVLKQFSNIDSPENEKDNSSGIVINRYYQNSLLNPVPEDLTCEDVGVSSIYCACYPRKSLDIMDDIVRVASEITLSYVNSFLPMDVCAELKVEKVLSGDVMDKSDNVRTYVVSFLTTPGKFSLEAYIDYNVVTKSFSDKTTATVQRTNKINSDISCVNHPRLELFCYCK